LVQTHQNVSGEGGDRDEDGAGSVSEVHHGPVDGIEFQGSKQK
jgi:hypothetical protein